MQKIKQIVSGAFTQLVKLRWVLFFLYASILLLFVLLHTISRSSDRITLSYFTRDISAIGGLPFYAGLVSQIGGLFWFATLAICVFTLFILEAQGRSDKSPRRFLLQASILSAVLLLDDFFLFHEDIGPDYLHIGEKSIVLSYLILGAVFLFSNRRVILASEYLLLGLALALFMLSIFVDATDLEEIDRFGFFLTEQFLIFLEDGFKFVGVSTWLLYFSRYGYKRITEIQ